MISRAFNSFGFLAVLAAICLCNSTNKHSSDSKDIRGCAGLKDSSDHGLLSAINSRKLERLRDTISMDFAITDGKNDELREQLRRKIVELEPLFRYSYRKFLFKDPYINGKIRIDFVINRHGKADSISSTTDFPDSIPLADYFSVKLKCLDFGKAAADETIHCRLLLDLSNDI